MSNDASTDGVGVYKGPICAFGKTQHGRYVMADEYLLF